MLFSGLFTFLLMRYGSSHWLKASYLQSRLQWLVPSCLPPAGHLASSLLWYYNSNWLNQPFKAHFLMEEVPLCQLCQIYFWIKRPGNGNSIISSAWPNQTYFAIIPIGWHFVSTNYQPIWKYIRVGLVWPYTRNRHGQAVGVLPMSRDAHMIKKSYNVQDFWL